MKITARNQFQGTISRIDAGPVSTEVAVAIKGGAQITVAMTSASAKGLKLEVGDQALAIVKATAVVLVTDFDGYRFSARNQLAGKISRVEKGGVFTLVSVALAGGDEVTATVNNDTAGALNLAVGQPATAVFKAYSVILGVKN